MHLAHILNFKPSSRAAPNANLPNHANAVHVKHLNIHPLEVIQG